MSGGGNDMDDLFSLAAPTPLMPQASAPTRVTADNRTRSAPSSSDPMNMGMMGGGDDLMAGFGSPPSAATPRARSATVGGDMMGDFDMMGLGGGGGGMGGGGSSGNLMGDDFDMMGMGGGSVGAAAVDVAPQQPGESDRAYFARRRESQKSAAIAEKVQKLKEKKEAEENNREMERDIEKQVKQQVQAWQREKKNIRALLASLHEIAPPCSWQPVGLDKLLQPNDVKKKYHKAILVVHPDKQSADDVEAKVRAQLVFDALRDAWNLFESQNK
uniref:J domain-containing protein n=1 Tax=Haptolina brevifila TaxID=156173 RepID=A0A7S2CV58_9EUKA|mmetsp:Transcript_29496/g.59372  ORF Transcript_29496/g.59372 Transcript_29496/m.59372 type:complete len:272 (+) Transcript_29496:3-818(+)